MTGPRTERIIICIIIRGAVVMTRIVYVKMQISSSACILCISRGVAQLARVPGLGPGGRRFESFHPDHKFDKWAVGPFGGFDS